MESLKLEAKWKEVLLLVRKQKLVGASVLTALECQLEALIEPKQSLCLPVSDVFVTLANPSYFMNCSFLQLTPEDIAEYDVLEKYRPDSSSLVEIVNTKHSVAIVLKLLFYLGKYSNCSNLLKSIDFSQVNLNNSPFDNCSDYSKALLLQILTFAVISENNHHVVNLAFDLLKKTRVFENAVKYGHNFRFLSCLLSRLAYVLFEMERYDDALIMCRTYQQYLAFEDLQFDHYTRIFVCDLHLYLLQFFRNTDYVSIKPIFQTKEECLVPNGYHEELTMLLTLYEYLVQEFLPYPLADQNPIFVDKLYSKITSLYASNCPYHESMSDTSVKNYGQPFVWSYFIESMYRATRKTFRSKTIMRRLGFSALLLDSYEEAYNSFKIYFEKDTKSKQKGDWWSKTSSGFTYESIFDIISAAIAASQTCLNYNQIHSAISYAEKAVNLCKENSQGAGKLFYPLAYCFLGMNYEKLSHEIREHEHFYNLQEQAHLMLREAEKFDSENWRIHYALSLQAATMGHVDIAMEHVKMIMNHYPNHIPSWHLSMLILLTSKNRSSELQVIIKARKVWENCIEILSSGRISIDEVSSVVIPNGLSRSFSDEWLSFILTKLLLDEAILQSSLSDNVLLAAYAGNVETAMTELLSDYRKVFEIYRRTFFPSICGKESTPLFGSVSDSPKASFMNDIENVLSVDETVSLNTFYPSSVLRNAECFPGSSDSSGPVRNLRLLRGRKLRYCEIWLQMAQLFRRAGKYHDARVACAEVQKIEHGNCDIQFEFGMIALSEAGALSWNTSNPIQMAEGERENIMKAIQHFQTALSYDDEHVLARTWLGRCYIITEQYELARAELERTIKNGRAHGSNLWIACYQLGVLHSLLNEHERAKEYFTSSSVYETFSSGIYRDYRVLQMIY